MAASHIFKVLFVNQGKVYEIYARKVSHGGLFGFVEVEELVFGERSTVVGPTRRSRASGCWAKKRSQAGSVTDGPWSPPMQSTATVIMLNSNPATPK